MDKRTNLPGIDGQESVDVDDLIVDELTSDRPRTIGERLSDSIAAFGGSWRFIIIYLFAMAVWILINTITLVTRPFDPYPFIFLSLILSCLSSLQAPIIMMSQNRQESRDRLRAEYDYRLSLKAETELRRLNAKIDRLIEADRRELDEMRQTQARILAALNNGRPGRDAA